MFVCDFSFEEAMRVDPGVLVGEFKQRLKAAPWEHELLLNDAVLPIELSLVAAGVLHESTLVVQRHEVSETLRPVLECLSQGTKKPSYACCSASAAVVFCTNCEGYLCAKCDEEEHQTRMGAKHVRDKIVGSSVQVVTVGKCAVHSAIPNSYYCATCRTSICSEFAMTSHKACKVVTREES